MNTTLKNRKGSDNQEFKQDLELIQKEIEEALDNATDAVSVGFLLKVYAKRDRKVFHEYHN